MGQPCRKLMSSKQQQTRVCLLPNKQHLSHNSHVFAIFFLSYVHRKKNMFFSGTSSTLGLSHLPWWPATCQGPQSEKGNQRWDLTPPAIHPPTHTHTRLPTAVWPLDVTVCAGIGGGRTVAASSGTTATGWVPLCTLKIPFVNFGSPSAFHFLLKLYFGCCHYSQKTRIL